EVPDSNLTGDILITNVLSVDITEDSILISEGRMDTLTSTYTDPSNNSPYTYTWTVIHSGDVLPIYNITGAVYTATDGDSAVALVLQDAMGCQAYDTVRTIVIPCEKDLLIPNVFTPNGDSLNSTYYIEDLCPIPDFKFEIFNRWGNLVFESNDYMFRWD